MSIPLLFWDVDTQADFMLPEGKLYVPSAELLIDNLHRLTKASQQYGIPVIASSDDHQESDAEISDHPDGVTTFPPHCMRGTAGAERIAATSREEVVEFENKALDAIEIERRLAGLTAPVVLLKKNQLDVFTNPNADAVLEFLAPERILLYGVATEYCNRAAIEGLLQRGYSGRLAVVEDAIQAIDPLCVPELLSAWRSRGVEMIVTRQAVEMAERLQSSRASS